MAHTEGACSNNEALDVISLQLLISSILVSTRKVTAYFHNFASTRFGGDCHRFCAAPPRIRKDLAHQAVGPPGRLSKRRNANRRS